MFGDFFWDICIHCKKPKGKCTKDTVDSQQIKKCEAEFIKIIKKLVEEKDD